ncbi:MAG: FHA domain-containing protein [Deltaproteobacteria bacterium]|nr:MAG: FHA domain-containing protein [Deltaproteobacteria bacterium]TMB36972.1 MAG: FHA domain-containing protein [Deltaproteobacteria bacterium]
MGEEGTPKTEMINPALLDGVSANFIVKGPSGVEKAYPMRAITVTVGRSDQCDIAVKDSSMSGRHAEISKINGEIRVRDMGSANGIWLNGERVDDVELFDGDVLRLGQTSIRVDVVGGRKRPDAGLSPKVLAGIIAGVLVLAGAGIAGGLYLKKRAQTKRDRATLTAFIAAARESQKSKPCAAAVDKVGDVARTLNTLGRPSSANPPKGDEARRVVAGYRELAKTYDRIAVSITQFAAQSTSTAAALTGSAEQIADSDMRNKVAEAQELVEQRTQVTGTFIADWKKLSQATSSYANVADQAFVQGNKALYSEVDRGIAAKTAQEVLVNCNRNFDRAKNNVEDKLKELDDVAGGAPAE